MQEVPQKVLNWLHSVLVGEYTDVNRTYSDVARTLAEYNGLHPSTDVYTFENGHSCLLLHLTGTLPVDFRGSVYAFPISLWVPQSYPTETPITFASPTRDMMVRPGQHVSGEGRIYHPYLAAWRPDSSSIPDLMRVLQDIFSREPPVIAKQSLGENMSRPTNGHIPPSRPPLPPELSRSSFTGQSSPARATPPVQPPPPPPKPFPDQSRSQGPQVHGAPPVPSHPTVPAKEPSSDAFPLRERLLSANQNIPAAGRYSAYRHSELQHQSSILGRPDPRTPQSVAYEHQGREQPMRIQSLSHPVQLWTRIPQHHSQSQTDFRALHGQTFSSAGNSQGNSRVNPSLSGTTPLPSQSTMIPPRPQPVVKKQPEDLLTSPFDPPLPAQSSVGMPAPPIPPNPEKDALLSALSRALTSQLQSSIASNNAALQPLSAQHNAMTNALHNLQREQAALTSLQSLLSSNETIIHNAMRDADGCIASAQHRAVPGVDDVLVAPTVVGQQLYELAADERACAETREVLGKALDRGRISSEVWVKKVRELAREEFLKKVLIRKCAEGMGLRMDEDWK